MKVVTPSFTCYRHCWRCVVIISAVGILTNHVTLVQSQPSTVLCSLLPSVNEVVQILQLDRRPEGGWFRETFRSDISVKVTEEEEDDDITTTTTIINDGTNSTTNDTTTTTIITSDRVMNPLQRSNMTTTTRDAMSSMYYLIEDKLTFHQTKFSGETWSYYLGSHSVTLYELDNSNNFTLPSQVRTIILGRSDMITTTTNTEGEEAQEDEEVTEVVQYTIPADTWYAAKLNAEANTDENGYYALIGTQAGPGFDYVDWIAANASQLVLEFPKARKLIEEIYSSPNVNNDNDDETAADTTTSLPFFSPNTPDASTVRPQPSSCTLPTVQEVVQKYNLVDHPEGGYFVETFRDTETVVDSPQGSRNAMTSIYYMMAYDSHSDFHRLLSDETWNYYFGAPIYLYELIGAELNDNDANATTTTTNQQLRTTILGNNLTAGHVLQYTVKAGTWFGAEIDPSVEDNDFPHYALAGTNVGPGFEYVDWELGVGSDLIEEFPDAASKILELTPSSMDSPTSSPLTDTTSSPPAIPPTSSSPPSPSNYPLFFWLHMVGTSSIIGTLFFILM